MDHSKGHWKCPPQDTDLLRALCGSKLFLVNLEYLELNVAVEGP
jgi:hypothetical protein